ncbi:hypothetical protein [Gulosibacter molinativorax]|uniref:Ig-like domain-containing protein n=1 Tax=Gulosibacter molinativorax TaxID=256821 RepID=A0ABT7CC69_9MICO|nr:hypothetical protein [Gulosibacter molinativorax]MDJ1372786.1 hypothetical protein [Gulosibacter molinativorax]QUY61732.1 Biotin carboxyl carrier protein [Gulosibacter molinativorax]
MKPPETAANPALSPYRITGWILSFILTIALAVSANLLTPVAAFAATADESGATTDAVAPADEGASQTGTVEPAGTAEAVDPTEPAGTGDPAVPDTTVDSATVVTESPAPVSGENTEHSPVEEPEPPVEESFATTSPTVSGTAVVGSTLTVSPGAWSPAADFSYQWLRGGVEIAGAVNSTYKLVAADSNQQISVSVTGTHPGYTTVTLVSSAVGPVTPGTLTKTTPKITGTVQSGSTLTATVGTWSGSPKLTYQWLRGGVAIAGATKTTYKLTSLDVGNTITFRVTASKTGYTTVSASAAVKWKLTAPTPVISGTTTVTHTLTANPGTWTTGTTRKYQWYRNDVAISGATGYTYKLTASDAGKQISVKVTGSKTGYNSVTKTSAKTVAIKKSTLKTSTPTITGYKVVTHTLTANPGTWSSGTTFKYQWYRNDAAIAGATNSTYKLTAYDAGKQIKVKVTGSKSGYNTAAKTSAKTIAIKKATLKKSTPTISGSKIVTYTLTANTGTWSSGTTFKYQWYRNDVAISGATGPKYKLTSADAGQQIKVKVTGSKSGYTSASVTSAKTTTVKAMVSGYVTPGAFCKTSLAGSYGKTSTGVLMKCTKTTTDTRYRWRKA